MITFLLMLLFLPLVIWWSLWLLFAVAAAWPERRASTLAAPAASTDPLWLDVLIPAHNEELLLPQLLASLNLQTIPAQRTLVIADHCSDRTAAIARAHGASVLERHTGPRGKPAALRAGLQWLNDPPTHPGRAVLVLDADCTIDPHLIAETRHALHQGAQVTQATYILESRDPQQQLHTPARIAFALKNGIRPAGMDRLGLPTQLFGTGMCFREEVLQRLTFHDHLTEDLAMSHDLLLAGILPKFLRNAVVRSPLPADRQAMSTQKLRWETGQIQTWAKLPHMLSRLLVRAQLRSAVALVDWSAPPVALAVLYWLGATFAMTLLVALHDTPPWILALPLFTLLCIAAYVIIGGMQIAGAAGVARLLLAAPRFALWKAVLYARMLTGRGATSWQRTPRTADVPEPPVQ